MGAVQKGGDHHVVDVCERSGISSLLEDVEGPFFCNIRGATKV